MVNGTSVLVGIQGFLDTFEVHLKRIWDPPPPPSFKQCRLYKRFLACGSSGHENKAEDLVCWNAEFYLDVSSVLCWITLFVPLNSCGKSFNCPVHNCVLSSEGKLSYSLFFPVNFRIVRLFWWELHCGSGLFLYSNNSMGTVFWMFPLLALPVLHSAKILTVCLIGE